jgi:hypothetical protein
MADDLLVGSFRCHRQRAGWGKMGNCRLFGNLRLMDSSLGSLKKARSFLKVGNLMELSMNLMGNYLNKFHILLRDNHLVLN